MAFVQKYEKGKTLINELKDSAKEYVVENVNETTNPLKNTSENVPDKVNTSDTPIIKPTINTKAGDKITINGVDINKKLLIDNLKKKSFSATGLNRVVWDKILGKIENLSEYNSSNPLDVDYGSDLKYNNKDLEDRGNLILADILKEASSDKYSYQKEEPFTFTRFLGSELGLGKDYNYTTDFDILKSFEEDQYEPEYTTNKKTGLEEIVKNKYTTNLSTLKRTELLSKYVDKEIENVNNSSEDSKYLHDTIDKTEYLNRLNEAKNAVEQLKRNNTIKNAVPEFYRIGIDVNKLFNPQQNNNTQKETVNPDGSKTVSTVNADGSRTDITTYPNGSQITKYYDKDGNEIKEDNTKKEEDNTKKEEVVKEEITPTNNTKLFSVKPQGLPEHMLKSDYRSYIINSVKNPFIPGSTQWSNWFGNPFSNPYDLETQPKEYAEWDKSVKGKTLEYSFSRPEGLKESIPSLAEIRKIDPSIKNWGDYIFKAKENPFETNWRSNRQAFQNKDNWKKWKEKSIFFNPYESYNYNTGGYKSSSPVNRDLWNKKYKLFTKDESDKEITTNEEIFKSATKDELNRYWNEYTKSNPKKGQLGLKIQPYSILDSDYKQLFENKNSIKHIPEEEKIKETITNKKAIGPSTILAGTELINNLAALNINKNIAKEYKNSLQAPTITATQYISPKIYQDLSRLNDFAALRNSSIPKTSDINVYQSSQRDFNKQLGEYLFKEQNQQATGIRQDREKVNAIQNAQLEENTKVANANEASRIAFNNKLAEITMGEKQKRGEILLNTLGNIGNFIAGYKNEQQNSESKIDRASYDTERDALSDEKQAIENDTTLNSEEKIEKLKDLNRKVKDLNDAYLKLLKNKHNSYFSNWNEKTITPKTNIFN